MWDIFQCTRHILSSSLKSVFYLCTKTSIYFDVARFFIANNGYLRTNQKGIENDMEQHIWYQELRMFTYINKHLLSFSLDSSKDVGNPCSNVVLISALLVHRQGQFMQSHICTDSLAVSMHLRSNIFDVYFKWLYILDEILQF